MPTFAQPVASPQLPFRTRSQSPQERVRTSLGFAIGLHAAILVGFAGWAWIGHSARDSWGEHSMQAGSISVTAVAALPLPPRLAPNPKNILASESESAAPKAPTPRTDPPPKKNEVLIPEKVTKPAKPAEKPAPEPPKRVPPPPETAKATTGETTATFMPMAVQQVKNGTASITVDDRTFGQRYAYYAKIVATKVSQSWNEEQIFPGAQTGMRTIVVFTINTDGTPSDPHVLTRSGSAPFDTLAIRTIQRIDGFGPLPQSKPITVEFALDYKSP